MLKLLFVCRTRSAPAKKANTREWHQLQQLRDQRLAPRMVLANHDETIKGFFVGARHNHAQVHLSKQGKRFLWATALCSAELMKESSIKAAHQHLPSHQWHWHHRQPWQQWHRSHKKDCHVIFKFRSMGVGWWQWCLIHWHTSCNNNNIIIADTAAVGCMLKIAFATVITWDRACWKLPMPPSSPETHPHNFVVCFKKSRKADIFSFQV